jgi:hypothetical protein
MQGTTKVWLQKTAAAFIGGFAGAAESALVLPAFDPDRFNFGPQLKHMLLAMLVFSLLAGAKTLFAYLKQAPDPWRGEERRDAAADSTGTGK